jgi:phage recombination protein Bet
MSTELAMINDHVNELMKMSELPREKIVAEMDRNYLAQLVKSNPNLAKEDFVNFITKCQLTGADPRMNQIYLIVHNAWNAQTRQSAPKGTTVFSYQFFLRLAQQTGQLESMEVDTVKEPYLDFNSGEERPSVTTKCHVKRAGQGKITYQARFWEFAKTDKDGKLQGNWKSAPYLMLEKCAVANALRWAFPETLGNMYIADEMEKSTGMAPKANHVEKAQKVEVITAPQPKVESEPVYDASVIDSIASERTLEDMKGELLEFIQALPDEWFSKLGKMRSNLIKIVENEKTTDGVKLLYSKTMEYDDKYREMTK